MGANQKAKLFTHGGSQAVRLPKAFRFDGSEVNIAREGDRVILQPSVAPASGPGLWARIDALRGDEQLAYSEQPRLERVVSLD